MIESDLNPFERILAALHEAALDPARWPGASALIDELLGTHGNTLALGDGESEEDYRTYFMWICHRGQRRRDLERLWMETHYPVDERLPRLRRLPFCRLFRIADLYTEEERKTSESYNALRTLARAGDGIDVRLDGPGGSRILWEIDDPVNGDGWSSAQRDWIRRLLPHVRQTVQVRQTLARADALGATLTEMLDATGLGIVQLDTRGRILAANDRARDLLRGGGGLCDRQGFLYARMPRDNDDLRNLLRRALPPFGARGTGGSAIVRRPGALPPLVLHVHPVDGRQSDYPLSPIGALVLIVDPAGGAVIDPAAVASALDLTAMESRVAVLLAQGMTVREIAAAAGRKESTVRSHVKHIFAKHGISRQADLVRLVRSLAGTGEARPSVRR
ncbi:MAG: helix-turn-helix transcriptional regulator [Defluviicoccus sp.]|nr:helix-turn-helix transcriptional regulator [Defluviicoccus sp.]